MDCGKSCFVVADNKPSKGYGHIDTNGLVVLISSGIPVVILDARSGQWDDGKRIAKAKNLSYEATKEEAAKIIPGKDSLIVVYCSNAECPASTHLAKRLTDLGYSNILKYSEGIQQWISSGYPVRESR